MAARLHKNNILARHRSDVEVMHGCHLLFASTYPEIRGSLKLLISQLLSFYNFSVQHKNELRVTVLASKDRVWRVRVKSDYS